MNFKKQTTFLEFFYACPSKSTALYQDFIFILKQKSKKKHSALVSAQDLLNEEDQKLLNLWIQKKEEDYPLQYFINQVEFCGLEFYVEEGALIPRFETEEMVFYAIKERKTKPSAVKKILDVGAGTGCIGISASFHLKESVEKTVLIEPSKEALKSLRVNVERFNSKDSKHLKSLEDKRLKRFKTFKKFRRFKRLKRFKTFKKFRRFKRFKRQKIQNI